MKSTTSLRGVTSKCAQHQPFHCYTTNFVNPPPPAETEFEKEMTEGSLQCFLLVIFLHSITYGCFYLAQG